MGHARCILRVPNVTSFDIAQSSGHILTVHDDVAGLYAVTEERMEPVRVRDVDVPAHRTISDCALSPDGALAYFGDSGAYAGQAPRDERAQSWVIAVSDAREICRFDCIGSDVLFIDDGESILVWSYSDCCEVWGLATCRNRLSLGRRSREYEIYGEFRCAYAETSSEILAACDLGLGLIREHGKAFQPLRSPEPRYSGLATGLDMSTDRIVVGFADGGSCAWTTGDLRFLGNLKQPTDTGFNPSNACEVRLLNSGDTLSIDKDTNWQLHTYKEETFEKFVPLAEGTLVSLIGGGEPIVRSNRLGIVGVLTPERTLHVFEIVA